jgi:hypothetical protein
MARKGRAMVLFGMAGLLVGKSLMVWLVVVLWKLSFLMKTIRITDA